jgi:hypothetical protein
MMAKLPALLGGIGKLWVRYPVSTQNHIVLGRIDLPFSFHTPTKT